jgi:excisionase family DNA binding protein
MDQAAGLDHASARVHSGDQLAASIQRASEISGLGRSSLYKAMKDGDLPYVKVGKRRLIIVDDLRADLMKRRRIGGSEGA